MKRSFQHTLGFLKIGAVLALTWYCACDSTASISVKEVKFDRLMILSSVGTVDNGGADQRACEIDEAETVTGLDLAFVMKSADRQNACGGEEDQDQGIRPGDLIARKTVTVGSAEPSSRDVNIVSEIFSLAISCVEPYPDADLSTTRTCAGAPNPTMNLSEVEWHTYQEAGTTSGSSEPRCEPAAVALLIDTSGSMLGYVDPDNGFREDQPGQFQWPDDGTRAVMATDPTGIRFAVASTFVKTLNENDRLVAFTYQERQDSDDLEVICTLLPLDATGDLTSEKEYVRKALNCFGVQREIVTSALERAKGGEEGRTPLWSAVKAAYEFLQRDDAEAPHNRHIVVIGDGPDTCNAEAEEFIAERTQCGGTTYPELREFIEAKQSEPGAVPIHIHFVQLQAKAYPWRDARQQELACLTDGHHQFLNLRDLQRSDIAEALTEAMSRIRYALSGYWTLRATTAAFDVSSSSTPGYLAPGTMFAVGGSLTLAANVFTAVERAHDFDAGGSDDSGGPWDQRTSFRRTCDQDADCLAPGATPEPCRMYCSTQQKVCLDSAQVYVYPDSTKVDGNVVPTACTTAGGGAGTCCAGVCETAGCN